MENLFEYFIETDDFYLRYAKGEPKLKEQEFHDYNEFIFFINGSTYFISKNIQQNLNTGNIVVIPKEEFHQFCVKEPQKYIRCILGFYENSEIAELVHKVMDNVKIINAPDKRIVSVFERLMEVAKSHLPKQEKILFIKSALVQLLINMKLYASGEISKNLNLSPVVSRALNIIDEKYAENLSVNTIADVLYISPSTLAHKFSKELNIPVYRYIIQKRLSVAHNLILSGESMTAAANQTGFPDYSCFYRLYKKYYKK